MLFPLQHLFHSAWDAAREETPNYGHLGAQTHTLIHPYLSLSSQTPIPALNCACCTFQTDLPDAGQTRQSAPQKRPQPTLKCFQSQMLPCLDGTRAAAALLYGSAPWGSDGTVLLLYAVARRNIWGKPTCIWICISYQPFYFCFPCLKRAFRPAGNRQPPDLASIYLSFLKHLFTGHF